MYAEDFPAKLKKARENAGFTQREVELETNIKQPTLAGYEIGRTQPDLETLGILADFYQVSVDWLLGTKSFPKTIESSDIMAKKIQIGLRVTEEVSEKLRKQAEKEQRSVNNLIEVIINKYLEENQ